MASLGLTDKEQLAMLYLLVKQVSQEEMSSLLPRLGRNPPSFAAFANLVSRPAHHLDMLLNRRTALPSSDRDLGSHEGPVYTCYCSVAFVTLCQLLELAMLQLAH